jgi:hypothetical protein
MTIEISFGALLIIIILATLVGMLALSLLAARIVHR